MTRPEKLLIPSFSDNYTSSQFLTEVQGGSDVGANDTRAWQDENGEWFIRGEKWFCSNANAELMVISARHDTDTAGTKGLSVFLVPSVKPDGSPNHFTMRRLKEKMGTRALASAEIDYHDAYAIPLGDIETGFNVMMEKVIHHSRISLAVAVLGFVTRAYQLANDFAKTRHAFGKPIIQYPLVQENLAQIKSDMTVSMAGTFALIALQDDIDTKKTTDPNEIAFARYNHDEAYLDVMGRRIAEMPQYKAQAEAALGEVTKDLGELNELPHDLQTLKIASTVKAMANLFYFVEAVMEGCHQQEHDDTSEKLKAAVLFYDRFILGQKARFDEDYLALCREVIGA